MALCRTLFNGDKGGEEQDFFVLYLLQAVALYTYASRERNSESG